VVTVQVAVDSSKVGTADGERVRTRYVITAVGCLSEPYVPDVDGLEGFEGEWHHTARWPHDGVDLAGSRVGVIGTGSTGIQLIPRVAERAGHLTVFQRTPNYAVPAQNRPLDQERYREIRERYDEIWDRARASSSGMPFDYAASSAADLPAEEVTNILEERWQTGGFRFTRTFEDLVENEETNERVAEFIRGKIRDRVDDPALAETLVPTDHPYATKRPPLDYEGYYETYNREDVDLVDVAEAPIERFTRTGIHTAAHHVDLEVVVFATGFDAMTGALLELDVRGRDGVTLAEKWTDGPRTYLGLGVPDFPNLLTVTGPQSPSVLTNMPVAIEQHVEWIADCIEFLEDRDVRAIEPAPEAASEWVEHTKEVANATLLSEAESWYRGANVPGKPRVFTPYPGGLDVYRERCAEVAANDYEGFELMGATERPERTAGEG
jgi:cation diffusion facilitator CzcD-associated flavoprotein CzcO